jgi:hypothetical protein
MPAKSPGSIPCGITESGLVAGNVLTSAAVMVPVTVPDATCLLRSWVDGLDTDGSLMVLRDAGF